MDLQAVVCMPLSYIYNLYMGIHFLPLFRHETIEVS